MATTSKASEWASVPGREGVGGGREEQGEAGHVHQAPQPSGQRRRASEVSSTASSSQKPTTPQATATVRHVAAKGTSTDTRLKLT